MDTDLDLSPQELLRHLTTLCRDTPVGDRPFYDGITETIRRMTGASFVVLNLVVEDGASTKTVSIGGGSQLVRSLFDVTGVLIGRTYRLDGVIATLGETDQLVELGTLCEVARHQVPLELCRRVERIFGVNRVAGVSIRTTEEYYGNVLFLLREKDVLAHVEYLPVVQNVLSLWFGNRPTASRSVFDVVPDGDPFHEALHEVPEEVPELIFGLNPDGTIRFINQTIERYGYDREALIGTPFIELVHPDDRNDSYYQIHERRRGARRTREYTLRLVGTAQQTRVLSVCSRNVRVQPKFSLNTEGVWTETDTEKSFVGTIGVGVDITERVILEDEVDNRASAFDLLARTLHTPVWLYDSESETILYRNDACRDVLQRAAAQSQEIEKDAAIERSAQGEPSSDSSRAGGWYPLVDEAEWIAFKRLFLEGGDRDGDGRFSIDDGTGAQRWYRAEIRSTGVSGRRLSIGVVMDIDSEYQAQRRLEDSIAFEQALNRETNHRIKNNLFMVESILNLESAANITRSAADVIEDVRARLQAISTVHEMFHQVTTRRDVDLGLYLERLARRIIAVGTVSERLTPDVDVRPCFVPQKIAVSVGMICGELTTNALKYAFPNGMKGTIRLTLQPDDEGADAEDIDGAGERRWRLIIEDNGVGIGEQQDPSEGTHIGFDLIQVFTERIDGRFLTEPGRGGRGTRCILQFSVPPRAVVSSNSTTPTSPPTTPSANDGYEPR